MKLLRLLPLGLLLLCLAAHAATKPAATKAGPKQTGKQVAKPTAKPSGRLIGVNYVNGVPDTGQFLPDSVWLMQVGPRVTNVGQYVNAYFDSYAEYRPGTDSLGRVMFLRSIANKEVLGLLAREVNKPFGFEERAIMREHTQRVLANAVFIRLVMDSVKVTDDDVHTAWKQYGYEQRYRHILFHDRALAELVRRQLIGGQIRWSDAVKKYTQAKHDAGPDGEVGWFRRTKLPPDLAERIFSLKPGEYSSVFRDGEGYHVAQALERRNVPTPAYETMAHSIRRELSEYQSTLRSEHIQEILRQRIGLTYDSVNVAFTAANFRQAVSVKQETFGTTVEVNGDAPEFSPTDTARVLARWKDGGRLTLSQLLHAYTELTPLMRPTLNLPESVRGQIDALVLEPSMAQYGIERGIDTDPLVLGQIEKRREQIMVERMYADSVEARVFVSRADRQAYYDKNKLQFVTFPSVDFAAIVRPNKASAESLATALTKGADVRAILHADSLAGNRSGAIQHRRDDEKGLYHKILFEELRPRQCTVTGPDKLGTYMVLQLLTFDPGRQLSFTESEGMIDESMQNLHAQAMLDALIARHEKKYAIRWRPELLMRVRLVDPTLN